MKNAVFRSDGSTRDSLDQRNGERIVKMNKGKYRASEDTRRRLLRAAGELIARRGVDGVTVRQIAARAGTTTNAVCYHFGSKDRLARTCLQTALKNWDERRLTRYLAENEALFGTRDGRRQIVVDLVDVYFGNYGDETQPTWANQLLLRSLLTGQWIIEEHERLCGEVLRVFCDVFRRVSGNEDRTTALCWATSIVSPAALTMASDVDFADLSSSGIGERTFLRRLQDVVVRQALFTAGLID